MKKDKPFDCVRMKWDIQQQIQREFAGVPEVEARAAQMRQVAQDPILGPLYRRLTARQQTADKQR